MKLNGRSYRTIWPHPTEKACICLIDQRALPWELVVEEVRTADEMATAIRDMHLRGAPLIGSAAAWGMYLAAARGEELPDAARRLRATRPTAVDLFHAVEESLLAARTAADPVAALYEQAAQLTDRSAEQCRRIGEHGLPLIRQIAEKKNGRPVNILTHCNAGWLACIDYGTATAPIYAAHAAGIPVHVWVDETRPRLQGSRLTACELGEEGVPHTVIVDNAGGHLMQHGMVDMVLVGSDRTTRRGDVANKIGTYLKALAAADNGIPFYAALPVTSIDWQMADGLAEIPIEQRDGHEVSYVEGAGKDGQRTTVAVAPAGSPVANYGFDVTPARLVTGIITERGVSEATEEGLGRLYGRPDPFGLTAP